MQVKYRGEDQLLKMHQLDATLANLDLEKEQVGRLSLWAPL